MMADSSHLDYQAPIREFKTQLEQYTVVGKCEPAYILTEKLKTWLKSKTGSGRNETTQVERLLDATYSSSGRPGADVSLPVTIEEFCSGQNCSLLVFSILLELRYGHLVDLFQPEGIVDRNIPVKYLDALKDQVKDISEQHGIPDLAERFYEMQWRFCAAQLRLRDRQNYVPNHIIPIIDRQEISKKKGATAEVYQIIIPEEFVEDRLREFVPASRFDNPEDNLGPRYQFALKTFVEAKKTYFESEITAFQSLQGHEDIIQYLGHFKRNGHAGTTYNILLEFGEWDLEDFFLDRLPPALQIEVEQFWGNLFGVADAVEHIHNFAKPRAGVRRNFNGWHADIKPGNILSVQEKFKLADPGFVQFSKDDRTIIDGGTKSFGAPECFLGREAVSRAIDIWSLGCVFSVVATWVVFGFQGVRQFDMVREMAIKRLIQQRQSQASLGTSSGVPLNEGDHFHDGENVLPDVLRWHQVLRSSLRKTDTITSKVLDLVDGKMLQGDPLGRIEAKTLCRELKQILQAGDNELRVPVPPSISEALVQVDNEAVSQPGYSSRWARSSLRSDVLDPRRLMKTSHRSTLTSPRATEKFVPKISDIAEDPTEKVMPPVNPQPSHWQGQKSSRDTLPRQSDPSFYEPEMIRRDMTKSRRTTGLSILPLPGNTPDQPEDLETQDVFQVHEEMERQRTGMLGRVFGKKKMSGLLTRYCANRDIVFLVDNAESMDPFWGQVKYVLEALVMKAVGQDKDGMDLRFTSGAVGFQGGKTWKDFKGPMNDKKILPIRSCHTNMTASLGNVMDSYINHCQKYRQNAKNLSLLVLTDAKWTGERNESEIEDKIIKCIESLGRTIGDLRHRPVGIQFIQFGRDAQATERLRRLDNDLVFKKEGIPDIVDTEHSTGNVYKMLLGGFVDCFDLIGDNVVSPRSPQTGPPMTPPQAQGHQPFPSLDSTLRPISQAGGQWPHQTHHTSPSRERISNESHDSRSPPLIHYSGSNYRQPFQDSRQHNG